MTLRALAIALAGCLVALPTLCTGAEPPPETSQTAAATTHSPAGPAPTGEDFIRETRVYFPQALDRFHLDESKVLDQAGAGVALRYGYEGTTLGASVFVYPLGRVSETQALDPAMNELLASFKQGEALGYYRDVDLSSPRTITIPLNPFVTLQGRQVSYSAVVKDTPVVSHSLLTYRSYFLFKVRITAPSSEKRTAAEIEREVIAKLLPALRVSHVGSCAQYNQMTVMQTQSPPKGQHVSPDGSEIVVRKGGDYGRALVEAMARKADSACFETFDEEEIHAGERFETLTFPAGAWKDSSQDESPASGTTRP